MSTGAWIGICFAVAIVSIICTVIITMVADRKSFQKQLKENPPITEKMVRAMFLQMGRKASEAQIKAVMRSMTNAKNEGK